MNSVGPVSGGTPMISSQATTKPTTHDVRPRSSPESTVSSQSVEMRDVGRRERAAQGPERQQRQPYARLRHPALGSPAGGPGQPEEQEGEEPAQRRAHPVRHPRNAEPVQLGHQPGDAEVPRHDQRLVLVEGERLAGVDPRELVAEERLERRPAQDRPAPPARRPRRRPASRPPLASAAARAGTPAGRPGRAWRPSRPRGAPLRAPAVAPRSRSSPRPRAAGSATWNCPNWRPRIVGSDASSTGMSSRTPAARRARRSTAPATPRRRRAPAPAARTNPRGSARKSSVTSSAARGKRRKGGGYSYGSSIHFLRLRMSPGASSRAASPANAG